MSAAEEFAALLGPGRVKTHPLERLVYSRDGGISQGPVEVVVHPETTAEVAAVVRIARRNSLAVVPRGAGTGLAGGAVPTSPSVVVVLTRMNEIHEIDPAGRMAWVGPGVLNLELSQYTAPSGLHYAPDPSSQAACTIGGNVATNAGGPHCLAEGTTVVHVLGMEFVTAEGEVLTLGGPAPDPLGLDLRGVVVGSEGTLGIVTRVLVRLMPDAPATRTLLLAFDDTAAAAATVSAVIAAGVIPAALEMMDRPIVGAVENFVHAGFPLDAAAVLLAELAGHPAAVEAETDLLAGLAAELGATSVRVAGAQAEAGLWWKGRKAAFGAVAQMAPDYYLHDTVVPRSRLVEVLSEIYRIADEHGLVVMNVFHAGDGNLHPIMAFDGADPAALARVKAAADQIVAASVAAGGSLSGEHGIGLEKRQLMSTVFSPVDLDAQARLCEAFDPDGLFNPDKVLPAGARCLDFGRPTPEPLPL
jgi:glycolate oxidase